MRKQVEHTASVLGSVATSTLAAWRGCLVIQAAVQPDKPLVLYDVEASPGCRRVREALTALHLDAEIRPCPRGGRRFRDELTQVSGGLQLPTLVDCNTGEVISDVYDIVAHLFSHYGRGKVPRAYRFHRLQPALGTLGSAVRGMRGLTAAAARIPEQPLALWSFEGSPFSRLVRERLCELELPYRLHNLGKEHWSEVGPARQRLKPGPYRPIPGGKRAAFFDQHQRVQVPYLEDPNTGASLFESARILSYLERTYAV